MAYLYKRVHTKHRDFVSRTKCFYYSLSRERKTRGVRMCATGEKKAERNRRDALMRHKYRMFNNFDVGDWFITLTTREQMTGDEFHKTMMYVFSLLRKWCVRRKIPLVTYQKTEASENGDIKVRAHGHVLIRNTDAAIIGKLMDYWAKYGNIKDVKKIYEIADGKLINYILNGGNHKGLDFEKYSHSRNLKEPKVEKRIYPASSFREYPRPPKDADGAEWIVENLYNGFPDRDGYITQTYELVRRPTASRVSHDFAEIAARTCGAP